MAYNSTIQNKMDFCLDCSDGILKPCIAKRCKAFHYTIYRKKTIASRKKIQTEIRKILYKDNAKDLELWFAEKIKIVKLNPYCHNCNQWIPDSIKDSKGELKQTDEFFRAAIAHIFAKSIFESVSVHENNFVIAAAGCGCHNLTHRIDTFSKMKIFPEAVEKFKTFEKEITETHKYLSLFKEAANVDY